MSGSHRHAGLADVHAAAEWELVLRAGGKDPGVLGTATGAASATAMEVAAAEAAILCKGDSEY